MAEAGYFALIPVISRDALGEVIKLIMGFPYGIYYTVNILHYGVLNWL